jgi:multicomponent Na+:H+ antiporter subunit E
MKTLAMNLLLALAWVLLTRQFNAVNFALGFAVGFGALWLASGCWSHLYTSRRRSRRYFFVLFFIFEVIKANIQIAYIVINPWYQLRPWALLPSRWMRGPMRRSPC